MSYSSSSFSLYTLFDLLHYIVFASFTLCAQSLFSLCMLLFFHYVTSPKHTSLYVTYLLCSCISLYMPFKYQYTSPEPSSLLSISPYHTSITLLWLHNFWLFINIYYISGIKSLSIFIMQLCTLVISGQQWKKSLLLWIIS